MESILTLGDLESAALPLLSLESREFIRSGAGREVIIDVGIEFCSLPLVLTYRQPVSRHRLAPSSRLCCVSCRLVQPTCR